MKEGLSRPLGPNPSFRLRLNSVLNSCTRRGSFTGNSLGVLGECSSFETCVRKLTSQLSTTTSRTLA